MKIQDKQQMIWLRTSKIFLFTLLMGILYIFLEVTFRALMSSKLDYVGHSSLWMGLVGGISGMVLGFFNEKPEKSRNWKDSFLKRFFSCFHKGWFNIPIQALFGVILITLLELGAGLLGNGDYTTWNYSCEPLNFYGHICLLFSAVWFVIYPMAYWIDDNLRTLLYSEIENKVREKRKIKELLSLYVYLICLFSPKPKDNEEICWKKLFNEENRKRSIWGIIFFLIIVGIIIGLNIIIKVDYSLDKNPALYYGKIECMIEIGTTTTDEIKNNLLQMEPNYDYEEGKDGNKGHLCAMIYNNKVTTDFYENEVGKYDLEIYYDKNSKIIKYYETPWRKFKKVCPFNIIIVILVILVISIFLLILHKKYYQKNQ